MGFSTELNLLGNEWLLYEYEEGTLKTVVFAKATINNCQAELIKKEQQMQQEKMNAEYEKANGNLRNRQNKSRTSRVFKQASSDSRKTSNSRDRKLSNRSKFRSQRSSNKSDSGRSQHSKIPKVRGFVVILSVYFNLWRLYTI